MSKGLEKFLLHGRVAVITGGAGILGMKHAEAIAEAGGIPVLWDINEEEVIKQSKRLQRDYSSEAVGLQVDVTSGESIKQALTGVVQRYDRIDILINNAANDPKVKTGHSLNYSRVENLPLKTWNDDLAVGLTGAFLTSRAVGGYMVQSGGGVILNIASDLGVIAPDQRIYKQPELTELEQPAKPVTYSVVKHGLIGLTKYLATYWAEKNVRVNALSPGGIYVDQPPEFVDKLTNLIPLGRMAEKDEYKAAVLFLVSDASSYMTGANMIIDGGRSCW
ncbi:MAG: SDR family oxidoreductase [Candidatus Brocadiaceae bacterium]|nr:SDR family oxidoreductase [Candidatus Brocadiaceae bacterium]